MDLVTLDFVKDQFDSTDYSRATVLQSRVLEVIQDYLNTSLTARSYASEVYDSKESMILYHMPLISVESILDLSSDSTQLVEDTDYYVYPSRLYIPDRTAGVKDLSVSYTSGLTTVPKMVYIVAEDLIRFWAYRETHSDEAFVSKEEMEDRSYTPRAVDERAILSRISRYRQQSLSTDSKKARIRIGVI